MTTPDSQRVVPVEPTLVEAITEKLTELLTGTYHCGRVWAAWGIGTMSADDFSPVEESDTPAEIAQAIVDMLTAAPAASPPVAPIAAAQDGVVAEVEHWRSRSDLWRDRYSDSRRVISEWHQKAVALGFDGVAEILATVAPRTSESEAAVKAVSESIERAIATAEAYSDGVTVAISMDTAKKAVAALQLAYSRPPAQTQGESRYTGVLDDPKMQELFSSTIMGALAFGAQNTNPPPDGHWLTQFWNIGRTSQPTPPASPEDRRDGERLDWLMRQVRGDELRRIGIHTSAGCTRAALDAAREG